MSPCSNSTHTPAPTCGRTHTPDCLPVIGRQGIAHVLGIGPPTSGTWTNNRPICIGSTLLSTVPRYLPQYFPSSLMSNPYAARLIGDTPARLLGPYPDLRRTAFAATSDFVCALLQ